MTDADLDTNETPDAQAAAETAAALTERAGADPVPDGRVRLVHVTTVPFALMAFFEGQIRYMKAQGYEVAAISSPGPELKEFAEREGIPVHAITMHRSISPHYDVPGLLSLRRTLKKLRPHIVHSHTPKGGFLGMIGARLVGAPVRIYHLHGLRHETLSGWRRAVVVWSERLACHLANRVLAVAHATREAALAARFCPPEKIKVLLQGSANGVDARGRFNPDRLGPEVRREVRAQWGLPPEALVLGFVGRVVRDKGIVELAQAWQTLREEFPEAYLLIVGELEPQDPVPPQVLAALQEDPRVRFTGLNWETPPLYAAMDVMALPTYREGLGQVLLEAAAMRLPVVVSNLPPCREAVAEGVNGLLAPPRDAKALAAALRTYLQDPELRARHGAAGRERMLREFDPEALWAALHQEYQELLAQYARR